MCLSVHKAKNNSRNDLNGNHIIHPKISFKNIDISSVLLMCIQGRFTGNNIIIKRQGKQFRMTRSDVAVVFSITTPSSETIKNSHQPDIPGLGHQGQQGKYTLL